MAPPKGSKYWMLAQKPGRKPKYTPETLWKTAVEYFDWVEDNPLTEQKLSRGAVFKLSKMRAMTIRGFCLFAGIDRTTFDEYEKQDKFSNIITRIRDIIYSQKFEGAAADLLNANIIARELGLAEKSEVNVKGMPKEMQGHIQSMTTNEIATLIGDDDSC